MEVRLTGTAQRTPRLTTILLRGFLCSLLLLSATVGSGNALAAPADAPAAPHPPIPVRFRLVRPGFVTLVIEDARTGRRVRNLVSETPFPAGNNTAWWDGLDDLGRDPEAARQGVYQLPGRMVSPGTYRVRGLVRPEITVRYERSVYSHGRPPWRTADKGSEWLTNHTPPSAILWVPAEHAPVRPGKTAPPGGQILAGSWVSEGGSGLAWLDTNGRKLWGQGWVGGAWTGVTHLARDAGRNPVSGVYAYAATAWDDELRLSELRKAGGAAPRDARFGTGEDQPVLAPTWKFPPGTPDLTDKGYGAGRGVGGLAARDGLVVVSLPVVNRLLFVDARARKALGTAVLSDPRDVFFDRQGRLLALSGRRLLRFPPLGADPTRLPAPEVVIAAGLQDPQRVTLDAQGNIYVSDWGGSHQVKAFSPAGKLLRAIGRPGKPRPGPYDPLHMNHPSGVTVDGRGRLWVAENDFAPKRLSVWTREGKLASAYYGPSQYGGGGELDPRDKNRFYYGGEGGGLLFARDEKSGADRLVSVYSRSDHNPARLPQGAIGSTQPQTVLYRNNRRYLSNVFNNNPTGGIPFGFLYALENGVAVPRAGLGSAAHWPLLAWTLPGYNRYFYARWSGQILPRSSETYRFTTISDDGVRLWVNGQKLIDRWQEKGRTEDSATVTLEAGKRCDIVMEFFQNGGGATARLFWESPSRPREIVPSDRLFPSAGSREPGGLTAHYHSGGAYGDLRGTTAAAPRVDAVIDFDWDRAGPAVLQTPNAAAFRARLPRGLKPDDAVLFTWTDASGDARVQPGEVWFSNAGSGIGGITVLPDLSFVAARVDRRAVRFAPAGFDTRGTPRYDLARGQVLVAGAQDPVSSGGDQALIAPNGWAVLTNAPEPFSPHGVGGAKNGVPLWSYPSLWHGLHASHDAPLPERPGTLVGTTRLLGGFVTPRGSDAGPVWAINGNKGNVYLFTADGLFVATLFRDARVAAFNAPEERRGMPMNDLSLQEENFWPMMTQVAGGGIYLIGGTSAVMRVEGLEQVRRLPAVTLDVTAPLLEQAQAYFAQQEAARQQAQKQGPLVVALRPDAPAVDGSVDDWPAAAFVPIDKRASAAVAVSGDRFYAAWKSGDPNLLRNQPEALANLFKTGGGLDLLLGNVEGGQRLFVTRVGGQTTAVLYRPRDPGAGGEPTRFISNAGINKTVAIDRVEDVSARVTLAADGKGNYELSVPLSLLRLAPETGLTFPGDVGILRGNGVQTLQRVYWHNKATGLVSDLATEAELTPRLWGTWKFAAPAPRTQ